MGLDEIPNEIFVEADHNTIGMYCEVFNSIAKSKEIPQQWQTGKMLRLYKGKKGECSSENFYRKFFFDATISTRNRQVKSMPIWR